MAEGSRSTGVVKWFDTQKGFGFITADDGNEDLFVHQSSIKSEGFRSLAEGEAVEFEIEFGGDGRKKAVDVSGPNGSFVQGGGRDNYGGGGGRGGRGIGSRGGRGGGGGGGGGYGGGGADGGCYTCGESGHFSRDCTQGSGGAGGGGGRFGGGGRRGGDGGCYSCGGEGHFARECPNSNT